MSLYIKYIESKITMHSLFVNTQKKGKKNIKKVTQKVNL